MVADTLNLALGKQRQKQVISVSSRPAWGHSKFQDSQDYIDTVMVVMMVVVMLMMKKQQEQLI